MRSTNTLLADPLSLLSMGPGVAPAGLGGLAHSGTEFLLRGKSPGATRITYSFFYSCVCSSSHSESGTSRDRSPAFRILERQNHLMIMADNETKLDSSATGFAFQG